ncbi:MAG: DnaJ domain-containing protein [Hyphomonadaceae bacterium]
MAKLHDDLGVTPDASPDEIKRAFRRGVKEHHPDQGGDESRFRALVRAHDILSDGERRRRYEETGDEGDGAEPDALRNMALGIIGQNVAAALEDEKAAFKDVRAVIRAGINANVVRMRGEIKDAEKRLKRMEANAARWARKAGKDGPDIIANMTGAHIGAIRANIAQASRAIEAHEMALSILDEYEYTHEAPKAGDYEGVRVGIDQIFSTSSGGWR